mgnify:FL=1
MLHQLKEENDADDRGVSGHLEIESTLLTRGFFSEQVSDSGRRCGRGRNSAFGQVIEHLL